jgi:hypothetical protein
MAPPAARGGTERPLLAIAAAQLSRRTRPVMCGGDGADARDTSEIARSRTCARSRAHIEQGSAPLAPDGFSGRVPRRNENQRWAWPSSRAGAGYERGQRSCYAGAASGRRRLHSWSSERVCRTAGHARLGRHGVVRIGASARSLSRTCERVGLPGARTSGTDLRPSTAATAPGWAFAPQLLGPCSTAGTAELG